MSDQGEAWRPIESAPRDDTPVLLGSPDWVWPVIGRWSAYDGWYSLEDDTPFSFNECVLPPTHWMPLPAPPGSNLSEADAEDR